MTRTLVGATQHAGVECRQEQLAYALTLMSWSWIARDCGVQIEHHAVHSGSLEAVRVLVEAGANLDARDTTYHGTPLDWAEYSSGKERYDEIAVYLRAQRQAR